jgi:hypothetical protein
MAALWEKIFRLKQGLRWWNRHVFGDVFQRVRDAEARVDHAEIEFDSDPTPEHRDSLHRSQAELNLTLAIEEGFWKQKAGSRWACEGDRNTRYFHSMVQSRRIKSRIRNITKETGEVLSTPTDIQRSAISFFQDLLAAPTQPLDPIRPNIIPKILTEVDNMELNRLPLIDEVREAIFSIDADSVAGPDGFSSLFYQHCWEIIKDDVFNAVTDFFEGGHLPRGFSATSIILLPKRENACKWTEFRPISLCTVFNKLITKLLNTRLSALLPRIISPPQSGFVPGRLIGDNVLLTQELLHTLDDKVRGGNVMLKLDMAKAYDRMDWGFIYSILAEFGFDQLWIDRIRRCISECRFSVLLNGRPCGFFSSTRGLRQGDPISPSLFIIAADYFSRLLIQRF